ncbi:putative aldouronate transport system substrate-binding protein [Paenibacillus taihuensis]|uniref:Putative aldouronate transport system substrate-binding protein n=1 Tax=Paenibacillus taihuensis TaxID=1156355 RepID=A0A3D9QWM2_9BACL|nr:ABC transporter substrate-binding protein [Paenibacillus taihuensis]REE70511.1 putative aldouronate transport system substrate-binding protein [Paenibacillus taihuensis]
MFVEKRKLGRSISLIVGASLILSALPVASAASSSPLAPYKLTLYYPGSPAKDEAKVEAKMNDYLKSKINATIDLIPIDWGQWDSKMNLLKASREPMDIIFTAQWNGHANDVAKGVFLALDDAKGPAGNLIAQYGKDITRSLDPAFLKGSKVNGHNYGIPTNKELAAQGGVIYRKDIADKLGLTSQLNKVKSVQDLVPILASVKKKMPSMTPLFLRDGDNFNSHYFMQQDYLGDTTIEGLIRKDGTSTKVITRFDDKKYMDQLSLTRDIFKKGYINRDAATTQLSGQDALKKGNVFMIVASLKPGKDAEVAIAANLAGKLKQINMTDRTVSTGETAGSMLGISSTSKDPARAMMFINLLHSDKYLNNLLNFGIEGTHYSKVSGEIIKPGPSAANYNPGATWMFGNQFLNYVWNTEASDKWAQFKAFNKGAKMSPALGFTFNAQPVKSQVAALVTVRSKYIAGLETGAIDPSKAKEFQKKEIANGLDKVLKEKQKQLDAFLRSK